MIQEYGLSNRVRVLPTRESVVEMLVTAHEIPRLPVGIFRQPMFNHVSRL